MRQCRRGRFLPGFLAAGDVTHEHIPDQPEVESERRQIFFGAAIGIPTFYVRQSSGNRFLLDLVSRTPGVRRSRRSRGFWRIDLRAFRLALVDYLESAAPDLVECLDVKGTLSDLRQRLEQPRDAAASGRLTGKILDQLGYRTPFQVPAETFNHGAETVYRETLRREHLHEAIGVLQQELEEPETLGGAAQHLAQCRAGIVDESLAPAELRRLICNFLLAMDGASDRHQPTLREAS